MIDLPVSDDADLTGAAIDAVVDIANDLASADLSRSAALGDLHESAMFLTYASAIMGNEAWLGAAVKISNTAIGMAPTYQRLGLFGGLAGLGWTIQTLQRWTPSLYQFNSRQIETPIDTESTEGVLRTIDDYIEIALNKGIGGQSYDLISGLVGIGTYLLNRDRSDSRTELLRMIVRHLHDASTMTADGISWLSDAAVLRYWEGVETDNYFNLGVAHGVPGALFFLSEAAAAEIERETSLSLLHGGLNWLFANRCTQSNSQFKRWISRTSFSNAHPLAWCYGDLGVTVILSLIAKRTRSNQWLSVGCELVDHVCKVGAANPSFRDPSLCHGSAGVAYLFYRLYEIWNRHDCLEIARRWQAHTLNLRRPGHPCGGYLFRTGGRKGDAVAWGTSSSLLSGSAGVGLVLLSMTWHGHSEWNRMLLLSEHDSRAATPMLNLGGKIDSL